MNKDYKSKSLKKQQQLSIVLFEQLIQQNNHSQSSSNHDMQSMAADLVMNTMRARAYLFSLSALSFSESCLLEDQTSCSARVKVLVR